MDDGRRRVNSLLWRSPGVPRPERHPEAVALRAKQIDVQHQHVAQLAPFRAVGTPANMVDVALFPRLAARGLCRRTDDPGRRRLATVFTLIKSARAKSGKQAACVAAIGFGGNLLQDLAAGSVRISDCRGRARRDPLKPLPSCPACAVIKTVIVESRPHRMAFYEARIVAVTNDASGTLALGRDDQRCLRVIHF